MTRIVETKNNLFKLCFAGIGNVRLCECNYGLMVYSVCVCVWGGGGKCRGISYHYSSYLQDVTESNKLVVSATVLVRLPVYILKKEHLSQLVSSS